MQILDFANYDNNSIKERFGAPEYSYLFVRNAFRPVLSKFGPHIEIENPNAQADVFYEEARQRGDDCILLTFCPPNTTPLGQICPTLPVFAWEYDTLPYEAWTDDPRENWLYVLERTGMAITHCSFSTRAVRDAMGENFPVWTIPAPVFDRFARPDLKPVGWRSASSLAVGGGLVLSAGEIDLSLFAPHRAKTDGLRALRMLNAERASGLRGSQTVELEGVIYAAVFNPHDGRKNWEALVSGFVWAFRDTATATLVLKLTRFDLEAGILPVLQHLSTLGEFACKIWIIDGLLSDEAYAALIEATTFAVNTAYGEGQCLPLMEYMSAGKPAVAAAHSAMLDYLSPENTFVVKHEARPTNWPHDERLAMRCYHSSVSFVDLVAQYRESYRVARNEPGRYQRMSEAAVESLRAFCSEAVATERFAEVVRHVHGASRSRAADSARANAARSVG